MKRLALLLFVYFFSLSLCAQKPLMGKVRVVSSFADYKVRVVSSFADLLVREVNSTPKANGEWQFVTSHEDFTIQFVTSHEDFTISYVSSFPGLPNGKSRLKMQEAPLSSTSQTKTTPQNKSVLTDATVKKNVTTTSTNSSNEVVVCGNINLPKVKVFDDYFIIERNPERKFPINARVQFVCDTTPDVFVHQGNYPYICNMRIPVSVFPLEEERQWLVVDTLPDFTIQMTSWKGDIEIFFSNGFQPEVKERAYPAGGYGHCWK